MKSAYTCNVCILNRIGLGICLNLQKNDKKYKEANKSQTKMKSDERGENMSKHRGKGDKSKTPEKKVNDGLQTNVDTTEFTSDFSKAQKNQHNYKEFFN